MKPFLIIIIIGCIFMLMTRRSSLSASTGGQCSACPLPADGSKYYMSATGCAMGTCPANSRVNTTDAVGVTNCQCNSGYFKNASGTCDVVATCTGRTQLNAATNTCTACPAVSAGYIYSDPTNGCSTTMCPANSTPNAAKTDCVCAAGYNVSGGACVQPTCSGRTSLVNSSATVTTTQNTTVSTAGGLGTSCNTTANCNTGLTCNSGTCGNPAGSRAVGQSCLSMIECVSGSSCNQGVCQSGGIVIL